MAQIFATVNLKTYVKHDLSKTRRKSLRPAELVYEEPPKANIWLKNTGRNAFIESSMQDLEKFVKRLYRNRNWTTYQVSYCKKQISEKCGSPPEPELSENELIECGKLLYSPKTKKIMKPLATSRKLLGYMRPDLMYMELSEYQDTISKLGYDILLKDYLKIKNASSSNSLTK